MKKYVIFCKSIFAMTANALDEDKRHSFCTFRLTYLPRKYIVKLHKENQTNRVEVTRKVPMDGKLLLDEELTS